MEIGPVRLDEIFECISGADIVLEGEDDSKLLSIVTSCDGSIPRIVAFRANSREERNSLLTGLR
jgi:hypothetical protein